MAQRLHGKFAIVFSSKNTKRAIEYGCTQFLYTPECKISQLLLIHQEQLRPRLRCYQQPLTEHVKETKNAPFNPGRIFKFDLVPQADALATEHWRVSLEKTGSEIQLRIEFALLQHEFTIICALDCCTRDRVTEVRKPLLRMHTIHVAIVEKCCLTNSIYQVESLEPQALHGYFKGEPGVRKQHSFVDTAMKHQSSD